MVPGTCYRLKPDALKYGKSVETPRHSSQTVYSILYGRIPGEIFIRIIITVIITVIMKVIVKVIVKTGSKAKTPWIRD